MPRNRSPEYENDIRPLIQNLDSNEFQASDLSPVTGYAPQTLGRKLKSAADNEVYSIEVVDRFPYVFKAPDELLETDTAPERNENAEYLGIFQIEEAYKLLFDDKKETEERKSLDEVYRLFESEGELSEKEVRKELNDQIDSDLSFSARMSRQGELFQDLREYRNVAYIPEEKKFKLEE